MNRRKFFKRLVAVAAGAVVVLTLSRNRPGLNKFKPQLPQRWILTGHKMLDGRVYYTKKIMRD